MKKWINKTIEYAKIALIILLVLALSFDGAAAAGRLFASCDEIDQPEEENYEAPLLQQGPPTPEELPGNMANGGKPFTEQSAILQAVTFIKSDNSNKRYKVIHEKQFISASYYSLEQNKSVIINNSHLVCSDLGRQFTLVGAKPSGTS